ncbi:MAG: DUF4870 domain-containing protein [Dehalococcoidia bacterium]|nr:MAG: DUF4870 domain-containing protein [Dehalococcoidia bacterium]
MAKSSTGLEENVAALLSYVVGWVTGLIFFLIEKDSKFVKFHAMQSIITFGGLMVISWILTIIPVIGWVIGMILGILAFVLWIVLMVKAYKGERYKLPFIGDLAEKWSA